MRTVNYSEILHGSAALAGILPADIDDNIFALLRTFHDLRLQTGYEAHYWPELCPVEQRYYRAAYVATETVVAGDERYFIAAQKYYLALRDQSPAVEAPATLTGGEWVENSAYWAESSTSYDGVSDWTSGETLVEGDQRRNPDDGIYYQCHTAHVAGVSFDSTKFGELIPFEKYIPYDGTGSVVTATAVVPIGEVRRVCQKNPRVFSLPKEYRFSLSDQGIHVPPTAPNVVWVEFRWRRPTLLGGMWDSETVYTSGQKVYFAATTGGVGNFYEANATTVAGESPATTASKWEVVALPYLLRGYLIRGGYADWLRSDGQMDKATIEDAVAYSKLEEEADKLQRQQKQVRRFDVG